MRVVPNKNSQGDAKKRRACCWRYRGADFIYKGIVVAGKSMSYVSILPNYSIGSVRNSRAFSTQFR